MYLDIHMNGVGSYGSSPLFFSPYNTYGRLGHLQHDAPAGGSGLEPAIVDADAAMPPEGLPVASERAGGESRRLGLKRKAGEITRSAAEDVSLLTARTASARYAADFLSTVRNVSFSHKDQIIKYTLNYLKKSKITSKM
jgi:hypothetical protein